MDGEQSVAAHSAHIPEMVAAVLAFPAERQPTSGRRTAARRSDDAMIDPERP